MRVPVRTDAPWCAECGQTLPAHWSGCPEAPEQGFDAAKMVGNEAVPALLTQPGTRPPSDETGDDMTDDTRGHDDA